MSFSDFKDYLANEYVSPTTGRPLGPGAASDYPSRLRTLGRLMGRDIESASPDQVHRIADTLTWNEPWAAELGPKAVSDFKVALQRYEAFLRRRAVSAGGAVPDPTFGATTLRRLLGADGRLWAKSEFGPVHDGWPAMSFSHQKIAADFARGFRRGRDFVLFVGTTDPKSTKDPAHRSMVLCAATFEGKAPISTNQIVPPESWDAAVAEWGNRWQWSLPVTESYDFSPLLSARHVMPRTYSGLGKAEARGRCIEVAKDELDSLLDAPVVRRPLKIQAAVRAVVDMNPGDRDLRRALSQQALNIQQRIALSGADRIGLHPIRKGPNLSDIVAALSRKWDEQEGRCRLCGEQIRLRPKNRLLQLSADRIDSSEKTYDPDNVHITHLGCNLAKSSASMDEWQEYLAVLRGAPEPIR